MYNNAVGAGFGYVCGSVDVNKKKYLRQRTVVTFYWWTEYFSFSFLFPVAFDGSVEFIINYLAIRNSIGGGTDRKTGENCF